MADVGGDGQSFEQSEVTMDFLLCAPLTYYGRPGSHDPLYFYFHNTLRALGHNVLAIDTQPYGFSSRGRESFQHGVLNELTRGNFAATIVATYGHEFEADVLDTMRKHSLMIAWNSDDDWRWQSYSSKLAPRFDLMYTTYKEVYDANKSSCSSLRLSQWACLDAWERSSTSQDLDFTFVGKVYGYRRRLLYELHRRCNLQSFGEGTGAVTGWYGPDEALTAFSKVVRKLTGVHLLRDDYVSFERANGLWERSKLSLNPMRSSRGDRLQIKSRTFDMGLSGTVMLCEAAPNLELYYERGKEFVSFEDVDDLVQKVEFMISHEYERRRIAEAYRRRTMKEHLWSHRIRQILSDAGLS